MFVSLCCYYHSWVTFSFIFDWSSWKTEMWSAVVIVLMMEEFRGSSRYIFELIDLMSQLLDNKPEVLRISIFLNELRWHFLRWVLHNLNFLAHELMLFLNSTLKDKYLMSVSLSYLTAWSSKATLLSWLLRWLSSRVSYWLDLFKLAICL